MNLIQTRYDNSNFNQKNAKNLSYSTSQNEDPTSSNYSYTYNHESYSNLNNTYNYYQNSHNSCNFYSINSSHIAQTQNDYSVNQNNKFKSFDYSYNNNDYPFLNNTETNFQNNQYISYNNQTYLNNNTFNEIKSELLETRGPFLNIKKNNCYHMNGEKMFESFGLEESLSLVKVKKTRSKRGESKIQIKERKTRRFKDLFEPPVNLDQPNVTTIMQRPVDMCETKRYRRKNIDDIERRRIYACKYDGLGVFFFTLN